MTEREPIGGLIRAAERRRRQRRWTAETFPTSIGGLMRAPYPSGLIPPPATGGEALFGSAPIGELMRVAIHHEHHGPGEPLIFSNVITQLGFADAELPGVEIELPHTAIYGIEGDFSYMRHDDEPPFVGGGEVSLLLNGAGIPGLSPIRAGGVVDRSIGKTFSLAQEFYAAKGDRLSIVVDGYQNGEPDIQGVIEVATKEPLRVFVPVEPSPLNVDILGTCNCVSQVDGNDVAVYWDPHDIAGLEPGDLVVNHAYVQPSPAFPSSDGLQIFFENLTANYGWQLVAEPIVKRRTVIQGFDSATYDFLTFMMAKRVTQDDINWASSNPHAPDSLQEYARIRFTVPQTPGMDPIWIVLGQTVSCPFPGGNSVEVVDRQFVATEHTADPPLTPFATTLETGSSPGPLTSIVLGTGAGLVTSEFEVDDWELWSMFLADPLRVQRAIGPQTPRTINITSGNLSGVVATMFRVT